MGSGQGKLVWVLSGRHSASRNDIAAALETRLRAKELVIAIAGCDHTATIGRDAAKHCGMRLID